MSLNLDKSAWERVAFRDVVRNVSETVKDAAAIGIDRVVAMEHMDPGELTIARWGEVADGTTFTRRVRPGQTLFGKRRAYQRKVALAEFDAICSGDIYTFVADETRLLGQFLPFLVQSEPFFDHALGTSAGSLSPRTNWRDLANFQLDLPPLDEQKRIADFLWSVEQHRLAALKVAETVSTAMSLTFADRLERGVEEHGWTRDVVTSLVDKGPKNGKSAPSNDEDRGVPTLSISAVRGGRVRGGGSVKYIDVDPRTVTGFRLQEDDFLIVRGNGNRQLTGRGGLVVGGLPIGCIYPDLLVRLRFNASKMLPSFAAEQWNSTRVHAALLKNAKSTNGIWKINGQDIKRHSLVVPPLTDQARLLAEIHSFKSSIDAANAEAGSLKDLLGTVSSTVFGGN